MERMREIMRRRETDSLYIYIYGTPPSDLPFVVVFKHI